MTVLLIEDDDEKADSVRKFVSEMYSYNDIRILRSFQSGLRAALTVPAKLILLDMTMTNFERTLNDDGGRPHHFAGREILRQMQREGIQVPVVVITQFGRFGEEAEEVTLSELQVELKGRFPDYLGTVHYRSNVDEWKSQLAVLIGDLLGGHS